jgi:uncharacterized protein
MGRVRYSCAQVYPITHRDAHDRNRNRLADETSPYLLQHADNPVDWHPWDEEALELARARRQADPAVHRLLRLSLVPRDGARVLRGRRTSRRMNELFVNIKVDREERPDLDRIYQLAHQMITQRNGGWPLTMFLAPDDQSPFFGGTYFPPVPRHGLPGFPELLDRVAGYWRDHQDEIPSMRAPSRRPLRTSGKAPAGDDPAA